MGHIATVVLSDCTREFDKEYDYIIPDSLKGRIVPGIRVIVPFGQGNTSREAYVVRVTDFSSFEKLKEIREPVDDAPVLNSEAFDLASFMKNRYLCTCGSAIKCMLPAGLGIKKYKNIRLVKNDVNVEGNAAIILSLLSEAGGECEYDELKERSGLKSFAANIRKLERAGAIEIREEFFARVSEKTVRVAFLAKPREEVIAEIESGDLNKIQQIRVLEILLENDYVSAADLTRFAGASASVLNTLRKNGYIEFKDVEVKRNPFKVYNVSATKALQPTKQQAYVLDVLKGVVRERIFKEALLHGVTGSGKTEVYMQLIEAVMELGRQALVLVPEISLTPQMVERFMGRFGRDVAVLHSRLSLGERYDQWRLIKEGKVRVVVGARSAVFAPLKDIGIIIIDEEHETSYKSEITPKYHAAEIARYRCRKSGALLLLGSATPSVETFYRAMQGEIGYYELTERANSLKLPEVEIVDMRTELEEGNRSVFSRKLSEEISDNISKGQQTILLLNRRGYSSFVLCRSCGYVVKCKFCNVSLTYHAKNDRLLCHYCGYTVKLPSSCPACKSSYIRHFGTGTQKIEEALLQEFDGITVIRMDADTTGFKNAHYEILKEFREKNINVLVGTQMVAKGHDFPNVTLVGMLAADAILNMADYRSAERTFQLITQVAGRAGRGDIPGRVIIQTYNTDDFSIRTACSHDYREFYKNEIAVRKQLLYPPFTNIAVIIMSGVNDRNVKEKITRAKGIADDMLKGYDGEFEVNGPKRAPISRIKGKYRWRIIIKCKNENKIVEIFKAIQDSCVLGKGKTAVELNMDINPVSML